jgi:hypothetical protein
MTTSMDTQTGRADGVLPSTLTFKAIIINNKKEIL